MKQNSTRYVIVNMSITKLIEKFYKNRVKKYYKYENVDSHFKSDFLYISINPNCIINELTLNYDYQQKLACYNTIVNLLYEMDYNYHKISKSKVIDRISETDAIFENVN